MKSKLKFLTPNKKIVVIFVMLTMIMGLATLQGENFSDDGPSIFYIMLSWATGPAWNAWLYLSAPILYFFGVTPQSSIRWVNFESWEIVYGLNFIYYYFVSVTSTEIWNYISNRRKRQ